MSMAKKTATHVSFAAANDGEAAGRFRRGIQISGSSSTTNLSSGDKCTVVRPDGTVIVIPCDRFAADLNKR